MSYMPARYFTLSHEPYKTALVGVPVLTTGRYFSAFQHFSYQPWGQLVDTSLLFSTSHTSTSGKGPPIPEGLPTSNRCFEVNEECHPHAEKFLCNLFSLEAKQAG